MFWKNQPTTPLTLENLRDRVDAALNDLRAEYAASAKRVEDAMLYAEEVAAMENINMSALMEKILAAEKQSVALTTIVSL